MPSPTRRADGTTLAPAHRPAMAALPWALALIGLGTSLGAQAQATSSAESSTEGQLPTVTVTATKRVESLQRIPVAVSVIDGEALERANRNTLGGLAAEVPSLNFRTGASNKDTSLFIRGVGTISTSPGVEPTVATVIDGVPLARPGQATLDLVDVQRIEVLRGPQGTLFGKNASAGVINIISRPASNTTEGYVDLAHYGGGNETRLRTGVSGALATGLRASLNALIAHEDGNVRNVFDGSKVNGYDKRGLRARMEWDLDRDNRLILSGDALNSHDDIPTGVITRTALIAYPSGTVTSYPAFAAALAPVQASDDNRSINTNLRTQVQDRNRGLALQWDHQFGDGHQLTAITGWRAWDNTQLQDGDRLPQAVVGLPQSHDRGQVDFQQLSQELRLSSPQGRDWDYTVGLFTFHTRNQEVYRREVERVLSSGSRYSDFGEAHYSANSHSNALFGETRWQFSPGWRVLAGARWTQDRLNFAHQRERSTPDAQFAGAIPGVNAAVNLAGATRADGRSGRLGLQWEIAPTLNSYLTYSRGYKGPAFNVFFNMLERDTLALKPETSNSMEAGLKSEWLNRRLRLNLAAFSTHYDNYQANFFDSVGGTVITRLINAGQVSSRGVELDASLLLTPQLSLGSALAYTRARIDRFNCPSGAAASCAVDGQPLPFSPDWKAHLSLQYRIPLAAGRQLELGSDYSWQSRVQYDIGQYPDTVQGAYGLWNASVALVQPQQGWRVALVAKNLADKSYASFLARGGSYVNRWVPRDDQRYFGIQVRHDF